MIPFAVFGFEFCPPMHFAPCSLDLWPWFGPAVAAAAAIASAVLIAALRPLLLRHMLVHPGGRSAHAVATPQGAGVAVATAIIAVTFAAWQIGCQASAAPPTFQIALAATAFIAVVGIADDVRSVPVVTRLLLQSIAIAAIIFTLPQELRLLPPLPGSLERILLFFGGLWFVNLVNFMDGIDWMTASAMTPVSSALVLFGAIEVLPGAAAVAALALLGALIGFAPFNRPVARIFLGDSGSLPVGLLVGWLLLLVASRGHLAAAILLPLYYLADATLTLLERLWKRETVLAAHRTHYYQRAVQSGYSVFEVVGRVFCVNIALAVLATIAVLNDRHAVDIAALAAGALIVAWLLTAFRRGKR